MDIIYTDANQVEKGMLLDFESFDMAFGSDENNFELSLELDSVKLEKNALIYVYDTEYGGIIDEQIVNTADRIITYKGRTWHGILANSVLFADEDKPEEYLTVSGEANQIIAQVISLCPNVSAIITPSDLDSEIMIDNYTFNRFDDVYTALSKMLKEYQAKLKFTCVKGKIILGCSSRISYIDDKRWSSYVMDFEIDRKHNKINHLVCLGQGEGLNRSIIHLFSDMYGNISPYTKRAAIEAGIIEGDVNDYPVEPYDDIHYYIGTKSRVLQGMEELTEVYDYPNAEITENYVLLREKPENWATDYPNYYYKEDGGEEVTYNKLERNMVSWVSEDIVPVAKPLPEDFYTNWHKYYIETPRGYESFPSATEYDYEQFFEKPIDWPTNYSNYFNRYWDGIQWIYYSVESRISKSYVPLISIPTRWAEDYTSYYYVRNTYRVIFDLYKYKITVKKVNGKKKYTMTEPIAETKDRIYVEFSDENTNNLEFLDIRQVILNYVRSHNYKVHDPNNPAAGDYMYYKPFESSGVGSSNIPPTTEVFDVDQKGKKSGVYSYGGWYVRDLSQNPWYTTIVDNAFIKIKEEFTNVPSMSIPPNFDSRTYFMETQNSYAPEFDTSKLDYYKRTSREVYDPDYLVYDIFSIGEVYHEIERPIEYENNTYYSKHYDTFAELVRGGINRLNERFAEDTLEVTFKDDAQEYDVGDLVGATEEVTGINIIQFISKKIIKIVGNTRTITYKIGG